MNESITASPELERILALPRRRIDDPEWSDMSEHMTALLRLPGSTHPPLRHGQAMALHDIGVYGGAVVPLTVGDGKTLISLLAPYVLDAKRPILFLPANLIQKTDRERRALAAHWRIPTNLFLMSYQKLGVVEHEGDLEILQPDLLIFDESQKVKNLDAAVTRRIARWMAAHPETGVVVLTGTLMDKSLHEFGHLLWWALKDRAPVPRTREELDEWASVIDENYDELRRKEPGALRRLADPTPGLPDRVAIRRGFQRRLIETPGVVSTIGRGEPINAALHIRAITYTPKPITNAHFETLRGAKETPDGWELFSGGEVWMHARQLALGFHSVWDPRPPEEWRKARRAWFAFVREVLSRSRHLDSPEHVERAVLAGELPEGAGRLAAWHHERALPREDGDPYRPNVVAVWHDTTALEVAAAWAAARPGIVWTEHVAFGERLAGLTGLPYYGSHGLTPDGRFIDDADPSRSAIVSTDANKEGRNLQRIWSRNLITTLPDRAGKLQQLLGRTHRTGQTAPVVEVDVFLSCAEHASAWRHCYAASRTAQDTTGQPMKLLLPETEIDWPDDEEIAGYEGARWRHTPERFDVPV